MGINGKLKFSMKKYVTVVLWKVIKNSRFLERKTNSYCIPRKKGQNVFGENTWKCHLLKKFIKTIMFISYSN